MSKSKKAKMSTKKSEVSDVSVAVIDYIVSIANELKLEEEDVETLKSSLLSKQKSLDSLICSKMPKQKIKKDPNVPKRGKSSYIFFCMDIRETVKTENPDMKAKNITKELGRIWKEETSEDDKIKYNEQAAEDKNRYIEEMSTYVPPPGTKIKRKKKNTDGPKRPRSGYILFCNDKRGKLKETTELSSKEIISELGRMWREIKENEKKHYIKLASKDKDRYLEEKEEYLKSKEGDEEESKKSKVVAKAKTKAKPKTKTKKSSCCSSSSSSSEVEEEKEKPKASRKRTSKRGKKKT